MVVSFKRVSILGLGLIGTSWGLGLKRQRFAGRVVGCDRPDILSRALARGAIDESVKDPGQAVKDADLVILATPVGAILDLLTRLNESIPPRALVTDVGSTKRLICRQARDAFGEKPLFLGGHPLAGLETSGVAKARDTLFDGARYVLTPEKPEHLADPRVMAFCSLVAGLGARVVLSDPEAHDRILAYLSHLPQLLSTGLASLAEEQLDEVPLVLSFAASGFRDLTRLAESPYPMWRDICLTNSDNIQVALESMLQRLQDMKLHLRDRDLERDFERGSLLRQRLRRVE